MRCADFNIIGYAVLFLAMLCVFYVWALKKRKTVMRLFAQEHLLPEMTFHLKEKRKKLKAVLIILALSASFISLMRPQWGFHWKEVKRKGIDILIAIDTSKSMLAEDVKPNRLERSKLAVKDLLAKLNGDRIGLIAFSGSAFLQCPLTVDYNGFMLSLDSLDVNILPRGGTSIASAIREAVRSYGGCEGKYKVLVLISDGEDLEGEAVKAAEEAKEKGLKIYCIGIGTKEGELIPVIDETGRRTFLKDKNNNAVKSRLDEDVLRQAALKTGGSFVRATGAEFGLDLIYEEKLSKLEKREFESKMQKQFEERFQVPLAAAFALLFLEIFINEKKKLK